MLLLCGWLPKNHELTFKGSGWQHGKSTVSNRHTARHKLKNCGDACAPVPRITTVSCGSFLAQLETELHHIAVPLVATAHGLARHSAVICSQAPVESVAATGFGTAPAEQPQQ
jgi:hypothetical protein